jgi:UDP-N-acetylglucosamine transferase subunit ALG13
MIFVTIGTQLPFERLLNYTEEWAALNPKVNIFAQIGSSNFLSDRLEITKYLPPRLYKEKVSKCSVIVGHLGTGTIIAAKKSNKPAILLARKFELGEHRNKHQEQTANRFRDMPGIYIVKNKQELFEMINKRKDLVSAEYTFNNGNLIKVLRNKIFQLN